MLWFLLGVVVGLILFWIAVYDDSRSDDLDYLLLLREYEALNAKVDTLLERGGCHE